VGGAPWPGVPSFVVTHRIREDLLGGNGGTFAFDGLEAAARRAKDAAGDKDPEAVRIGLDAADGEYLEIFSPSVGTPLLERGLIDEVDLQVLPRLLGDGTRLYDVAGGSMRTLRNLGWR
jgi:dihydrofolate reductase